MEFTRKEAAVYLGAMLDGEGHVTKLKPAGRSVIYAVTNTDVRILDAVARCLRVLDIPFRFERTHPDGSLGRIAIVGKKNFCNYHAAVGPYIATFKSDRILLLVRGVQKSGHNHKKTHCPRGHEYGGANLYVDPRTGGRRCRACARAYQRARRERQVVQ